MTGRPMLRAIIARAWYLGVRLDDSAWGHGPAVALAPRAWPVGASGLAVTFRFGAVVLFDLNDAEETELLSGLAPFVREPLPQPELETLTIVLDPGQTERIGPDGALSLHEASVERLQTVAVAMAKSAVLSHYEQRVAQVFDRIEDMAHRLRHGSGPRRGGNLMREIGEVLLTQARTVGRVEVTEKPEITWDRPELDRLYDRLAREFELYDRDLALNRKLVLIAGTAHTHLDLLFSRRSLRVEWYIVILIVIEIVISLYELFGHG